MGALLALRKGCEVKTYAPITSGDPVNAVLRNRYDRILHSFAYKSAISHKLVDYPALWMLDSGAYSVMAKGITVDIDGYAAWALRLASEIPGLRVTNLDVIPAEDADRKTVRKAVKQSEENAAYIRSHGLRVIEVYHIGEPLDVWRGMIERRQDGEVLGLGGLASSWSPPAKKQHGDSAFAVLRDTCGWDKLPPVHGFGIGSAEFLYRYPFASIDASSYMAPARWGQTQTRSGRMRKPKTPMPRTRIGRGEDRIPRSGIEQARITVKPAHPHIDKILKSWKRRELAMAQLWYDRGVRILPEKGALL